MKGDKRPKFPQGRIAKQNGHFTINKSLVVSGNTICYFDNDLRADIINKAFNYWRKSEDGIKYFEDLIKKTE